MHTPHKQNPPKPVPPLADLTTMRQKTVVRFQKIGPAVYHSHHDMMRFWERALKRAGIPLRLTQGFNPHPRLVFPHALGLGIASLDEEIELELHTPMPREEILSRVDAAAGDTLRILEAVNLPPVKNSRQLVRSTYELTGWPEDKAAELAAAAAAILALPEITVERGVGPKARSLDIRPYIISLAVAAVPVRLVLELKHTQTGSARPDEISRLAAEKVGVDPLVIGIVKTGMRLE